MSYIQDYMQAVAQAMAALPWEQIERVSEALHDARLRRAKVFICGNGGSAATASHFVNDLNKGANVEGVPRFRALGLDDNVPLVTALSNDFSYADCFVEQLRNLAEPGDVVIGISGSGNSANVLNAMRFAREIGALTVGLIGCAGGKLLDLVDVPVVVANSCMEQIEDVHMFLEHAIVSALRDRAQRELPPSLILADRYLAACTPSSGEAPPAPRRAAILIDRDGVINVNRADHVKCWSEVELVPGAMEGLRELACTPYPIVIITNQAAVNRHLMSFEVAESINRRLMAYLNAQGCRIDGVAWCPHRPEDHCNCRKPKTGLLTHAAAALNLDLSRSYLIGDAESDIAAGAAAGCKANFLVLTGRDAEQQAEIKARWGQPCVVLADLPAVANWILCDFEAGDTQS